METNDEPKRKKKSTAAEVDRRVNEIFRLKLDGAQFHDIFQYASENQWDLTERQVREYMRRADEMLRERRTRSRATLKAEHLAMRRALFARTVNAADYRTALAILDSEAKITGLFDDQKELKKLAAEIAARLAQLEGGSGGARTTESGSPPDGGTGTEATDDRRDPQ